MFCIKNGGKKALHLIGFYLVNISSIYSSFSWLKFQYLKKSVIDHNWYFITTLQLY